MPPDVCECRKRKKGKIFVQHRMFNFFVFFLIKLVIYQPIIIDN